MTIHISILFIFFVSVAQAAEYKVVRVVDGDTFVATDGVIQFKVRVIGMDAPESSQTYGKLAKTFLIDLIENQTVSLQPLPKPLDRYNRVLAKVFLQKRDVGLVMIEEGYAFYYRPSCKDYPEDKKKYNFDPQSYVAAENAAKKIKKGLWSQSEITLPCLYRQQNPI